MPSPHLLLCNIAELRLSVRSANWLRRNEIVTIGDLVRKSETELLRLPNFGQRALDEIKEALVQRGLRLGMQIASWPPERP
jgi:DNA-directed RNA polymerase subunit alpha